MNSPDDATQRSPVAALDRATEDEALQYPHEPPAFGGATDIAPGVKWLRMPMPSGALDHVNVWAIEDGPGWAIVDTGKQTEQAAEAWADALQNALGGRPVTRVLVTHMHPDHVGMAHTLTQRFGCELWMTRLEYLTCRAMLADTKVEVSAERIGFYRAAGWTEDLIDANLQRFNTVGSHPGAIPDSFRRMQDGQMITLGEQVWQVVVGSGHSPESASLYCPALAVVISGDQVLPHISSNIAVHPTEPDADPLAEWLGSLLKLQHALPADVLVLPGHGGCFHGLHRRLEQLALSHERSLKRLEEALEQPRRAVDVFGELFKRPIAASDGMRTMLATWESIAFLNHLIQRGIASRETDAHGVHWYRRRCA
jgi:glyoxylase-like metal-dependent hydrolase (beta-lactamase superfamily II)